MSNCNIYSTYKKLWIFSHFNRCYSSIRTSPALLCIAAVASTPSRRRRRAAAPDCSRGGCFWYSKQRTIHLSESDWPSPSFGSFVQGCVPIALYLNTLGISRRSLSLRQHTNVNQKYFGTRGWRRILFIFRPPKSPLSLKCNLGCCTTTAHPRGFIYTVMLLTKIKRFDLFTFYWVKGQVARSGPCWWKWPFFNLSLTIDLYL